MRVLLAPTLKPPQGMPSSYLMINRSSKRFLIAKAFKQYVSCLFLFMYAIGEMHQASYKRNIHMLIWAAKQKDCYLIVIIIKNSKLPIVNLIYCTEKCTNRFYNACFWLMVQKETLGDLNFTNLNPIVELVSIFT